MNDHERLLAELLEEQRKTNQLLASLIEALADGDEDQEPAMYLDGSPIESLADEDADPAAYLDGTPVDTRSLID